MKRQSGSNGGKVFSLLFYLAFLVLVRYTQPSMPYVAKTCSQDKR
ncbi:MAG: hypothetical protein AAB267_09700 [Candidatus Desantisbacteria bacterium]